MTRCSWCEGNELYMKYHDEEWGTPVHDDRQHFEFLLLETSQAGLSWLTVLKKRENYRQAFDKFNPKKVAEYTAQDMERLLNNPGIIRNKLKIKAAIHNAQKFIDIQQEFGSFDKYIWGFVKAEPVKMGWRRLEEIPATTVLSDMVSRDLKKRGFMFAGSTIIYAHLQATGIVNDHLRSCFRYRELSAGKI
ncbi:MAG: DNA-3-methyladenine glycosylase I [Spirochaetota bacterium]